MDCLLLVRCEDRQMIRDCKVIPREAAVSHHRVLAMDVLVQAQHKKGQKIRHRKCIRTWKLKRDIGLKDAYKMEVQTRLPEPDKITWDRLKNMMDAAKKVCGTTRNAYQRPEKLLDGRETAFREMSSGKN